jgi:hypothetical protein
MITYWLSESTKWVGRTIVAAGFGHRGDRPDRAQSDKVRAGLLASPHPKDQSTRITLSQPCAN